jgi:hypothetical protein
MGTKAIALAIAGFILGAIFGYFILAGQQVAQVSSLKAQVSSLRSQMEALTAERDLLIKRSNQLDLQIVQLNAKIAELNASLASRMRGEPAILAIRFSPRGGSASQVIYWIGRANRSLRPDL